MTRRLLLVCGPPGVFSQVSVKVVDSERGPVETLPERPPVCENPLSPLMLQAVALVALHVRVEEPPGSVNPRGDAKKPWAPMLGEMHCESGGAVALHHPAVVPPPPILAEPQQ